MLVDELDPVLPDVPSHTEVVVRQLYLRLDLQEGHRDLDHPVLFDHLAVEADVVVRFQLESSVDVLTHEGPLYRHLGLTVPLLAGGPYVPFRHLLSVLVVEVASARYQQLTLFGLVPERQGCLNPTRHEVVNQPYREVLSGDVEEDVVSVGHDRLEVITRHNDIGLFGSRETNDGDKSVVAVVHIVYRVDPAVHGHHHCSVSLTPHVEMVPLAKGLDQIPLRPRQIVDYHPV